MVASISWPQFALNFFRNNYNIIIIIIIIIIITVSLA